MAPMLKLALPVAELVVGFVCQGKDMRRQLVVAFTKILPERIVVVNSKLLVRVHADDNPADVGVDFVHGKAKREVGNYPVRRDLFHQDLHRRPRTTSDALDLGIMHGG